MMARLAGWDGIAGNYIDARNVSYSGSVTLKPYTSIILIRA